MNKKLNGRFGILCVILVACRALVVGIVSTQVRTQAKNEELKQYEQMIEAQENTNAELQEVVDTGNIDDYAADVARDQLGYGQSDEKVYVNITGK